LSIAGLKKTRDVRGGRRRESPVVGEVQLQDHTECEKQPGSTLAQQVVGNKLKPV